MSSIVRDPKDFWSGLIFIVFGVAVVVIGRDYSMGTAGRMGPAYFPTVLGAMLAGLGAVAVVRSMFRRGDPIGPIAFKPLLLIAIAVLSFGFLVRGAGLVVAILTLVMVSSMASIKFKLAPFVALAVGMAAFGVLVFVFALGLPIPVLGRWFSF